MSHIKNVILIGAGGNLGPGLLQGLSSKPQFTLTILARKSSEATYGAHKVIRSDFSRESLVKDLSGQDAVVCGISDFGRQKEIIDAAIEAGVKRFIPSDFGSNSMNEKATKEVPFLMQKKQINDYVASKAGEGNDFSYTSISCGLFFDWCLRIGFLGFDLNKCTATLYDEGNAIFSTTTLKTVGEATALVLSEEDTFKNRHIFIQSFNISQNQVLKVLEEATGKKWQTNHVNSAEQLKLGRDKVMKGDFSGILPMLLGSILSGQHGHDFTLEEGVANNELGLPKEDFEKTVKEIVKQLKEQGKA